jgi:CRP/FNR family transcriptional regulator, cyclic AMP receptor protein
MSFTWLEAIGYCGTLATFVSYSMRTIIPLRIASIMGSIFFITYGSLSGLWPILATELVLLPLNCVRLTQDLGRQSPDGGVWTRVRLLLRWGSDAAVD